MFALHYAHEYYAEHGRRSLLRSSHEKMQGEFSAIEVSKSVGRRVRKPMKDSGATMPEDLPAEEQIKAVKKRVTASRKRARLIDPDHNKCATSLRPAITPPRCGCGQPGRSDARCSRAPSA